MSARFYMKSALLFVAVAFVVGVENYVDYGGRLTTQVSLVKSELTVNESRPLPEEMSNKLINIAE